MNIPRKSILQERPEGSRAQRRAEKFMTGNSKTQQLRKWFTVMYKYYQDTKDSGVRADLEIITPFIRLKNPQVQGIAVAYEKARKWIAEFERDIRTYEKEKHLAPYEGLPGQTSTEVLANLELNKPSV